MSAAKEIRARLERCGLVAFCKTTGGKGLHVVTPLRATERDGVDWGAAKNFAHAVCADMADEQPDRYLVKMSKAMRGGRISSTICATTRSRRR